MTAGSETTTVNRAYVESLQALVENAPFPRLIGMQLAAIEFDRATIVIDADERHYQPFGMVHGGVLATLVDTATFWAAFLRLPEDAGLVNIDLKLNYLQPAPLQTLRAEGRCIRPGKTISYAEAHIYDASGTLLAHGASTLMALPGRGLALGAPKFIEG